MLDIPFAGKSAAIWYKADIRGGDDAKIVVGAGNWGMGFLFPKFGSRQTKWDGLKGLVNEAHAVGIPVVGWWWNEGLPDEGRLMAEHALDLGLDAAAANWESKADEAYDQDHNVPDRLVGDFRDVAPNLPLGLVSWWKPSVHRPDALRRLLAGMDFNMPMCYALENFSNDANKDLIDLTLAEYANLWNGGAKRTFPGFAAYDTETWSPTSIQLRRGSDHAKEVGCPGVWIWSWNVLIGKSGSLDGVRKVDWIDEIKSWDWPTVVVPEPTCEEKLADCMAFATEQAKQIEELQKTINLQENEIDGLIEDMAVLQARNNDLEEYRAVILEADPGPPGN